MTCLVSLLVGCRGRAQQEVYDAQMAHEIRVLEDQLYEADYQNRILVDKLESIKLKGAPPPSRTEQGSRSPYDAPSFPNPVRPGLDQDLPGQKLLQTNPSGQANQRRVGDDLLNSLDNLENMIDEGDTETLMPAPPSLESIEVPVPEVDSLTPPIKIETKPSANAPLGRPTDGTTTLSIDPPIRSTPILPAPGGPEPPGKRDLQAPAIVPGELLPPPGKEPVEIAPPGQIILPEAEQTSLPNQLKLHESLSGGFERDGNIEQMMLVVNVLDQTGRPIQLANYNVKGDLSVVLYDGDQEESESTKLGRWDFSPNQVGSLVKEDPISGFHIPIRWKSTQPKSEMMRAHVRLRSEEDEMRCEGVVKVVLGNAMAKWAPRGERSR